MISSRAWVFRASGDQYELQLESRQVTSPEQLGAHEILIEIHAVSLNYRDIIAWQNLAGRKVDGRVPASDGAGQVIAVGSNVTRFQVGDRVAGCFFPKWSSGPFDLSHHKNDLGGTLDGMLREHAVFEEQGVVRLPAGYSYSQGATLPCAGLTAWYALMERGKLEPHQTVLVLGTGGVSIFALQIAHAVGAKVIVTSSDNDKLAQATSLGAWQTINYRETPQWSDAVWSLTGQQGVDHIVEVGGPGTLEQSMKAIKCSGHIALIGVLTGFGPPATSLFPLLARNVCLNGIYVGPRDAFERLVTFLETHAIEPVIDREYGFADARDAFQYLASGKHFGKVVIRVG